MLCIVWFSGRALLQSNWKEAIDLMFTARAGERDEVVRMKQLYANGRWHWLEEDWLLSLAHICIMR